MAFVGEVKLGKCWPEAGQILGGDPGQTLDRCWAELAHLGHILGRFGGDLVRCWPNVFNLGALPVPCQDRLFFELIPSVFEVFPSKTVFSLESQPLSTLDFPKGTCAKP